MKAGDIVVYIGIQFFPICASSYFYVIEPFETRRISHVIQISTGLVGWNLYLPTIDLNVVGNINPILTDAELFEITEQECIPSELETPLQTWIYPRCLEVAFLITRLLDPKKQVLGHCIGPMLEAMEWLSSHDLYPDLVGRLMSGNYDECQSIMIEAAEVILQSEEYRTI